MKIVIEARVRSTECKIFQLHPSDTLSPRHLVCTDSKLPHKKKKEKENIPSTRNFSVGFFLLFIPFPLELFFVECF